LEHFVLADDAGPFLAAWIFGERRHGDSGSPSALGCKFSDLKLKSWGRVDPDGVGAMITACLPRFFQGALSEKALVWFGFGMGESFFCRGSGKRDSSHRMLANLILSVHLFAKRFIRSSATGFSAGLD